MSHLHAVPEEQVTLTVDASGIWEQKMTAIGCHRTQTRASPFLTAPAERQRLFLGTEHSSREPAPDWPDWLVALLEAGGTLLAH